MTENTSREDSAWTEIDRLKNQLNEVEGEVRWLKWLLFAILVFLLLLVWR
jgi:type IV secretory pathway TrbL component